MKKIITSILAVIMIFATVSFVACSNDGDGQGGETSITVTDQNGRTVTIDAPAQKIVSGYYISTSACLALGLEDKLVGIETGVTQRPIYGLATALVAKVASGVVADVGRASAFEVERALAADPDLIILPKQALSFLDSLTAVGAKVVVVSPESHEDLVEMIEMIAKLTGTEQRAEQLIGYYNEKIEEIEELTKNIANADKPTVYITNPSNFAQTAPKDMYQASIITSAGGKNAGDALNGSSWASVSGEQIAVMNPDIIVIPANSNANGYGVTAAQIEADQAFGLLDCVNAGEIYRMPVGLESWDSPCPSGILGTLWMLNLLHSDLYSTQDLVEEATYFYKTFYGFDLNPSIIIGA